MQLSAAITVYWLDKRLEFSPSTLPGYERTFRRLVAFLKDPPIAAVTTTDLRRFLVYLSDDVYLSRRSVHDAWVQLSSLWTWAEHELQLPHILRGRIPPPGFTARQIEPFTASEARAVLNAMSHTIAYSHFGHMLRNKRPTAARDQAIVLVLLDTGLRASELCALTIGDYDAVRGRCVVRHGKGDKERFVVLGQRTQKMLWKHLGNNTDRRAPLFPTRDGNVMEKRLLQHLLARAGERAGVANVHPHRFRHTFAINFLRNGGNLLTLKELLGHTDLQMVMRYARIVEADIEAGQKFSPVDVWRL